jgi:hypothetical protein
VQTRYRALCQHQLLCGRIVGDFDAPVAVDDELHFFEGYLVRDDDAFAARAKEGGQIPAGGYRVVVAIEDEPLRAEDFATRAEAEAYADDVEWEAHARSLAIVFDASFVRVHVGTRR